MNIKQAYINILIEEITPKIDHNGRPVHLMNSENKMIHQDHDAVKNFHDWFGNSNAVDHHGRPLVLYHGSKSQENIKHLLPGGDGKTSTTGDTWGAGVYTSTSKHTASSYTNDHGAVYPVYAKGNFIHLNDNELPSHVQGRLSKFANENMMDSDKARFDSSWKQTKFKKSEVNDASEFFDSQLKNHEHFGNGYDRNAPRIDDNGDHFVIHHVDYNAPIKIKTGNDVHRLATSVGYDQLKHAGVDGVIMDRNGGEKWLIAHKPNFKSAIGNNGNFKGDSLHESAD
jgi:ADP-Ribosyltransferase in polyvalent proteins